MPCVLGLQPKHSKPCVLGSTRDFDLTHSRVVQIPKFQWFDQTHLSRSCKRSVASIVAFCDTYILKGDQ